MFCQKLCASIKLKNIVGYVNEFNHLITSKQCTCENEQMSIRILPHSSVFFFYLVLENKILLFIVVC